MAEQSVKRRGDQDARRTAENTSQLGHYQESIRQAKSCLDAAGKRLKRHEGEQADDVLNLLRAATAYLQQAASPRDPRVSGLTGAE